MPARSLARFLAPIALVAVAVALFVVISSSSTGSSGDGTPSTSSSSSSGGGSATATPTSTPAKTKGRRTYTVKSGDTPSGIAEKTGVPLSQIQALNPDLDPQALSPGTKLRLRR